MHVLRRELIYEKGIKIDIRFRWWLGSRRTLTDPAMAHFSWSRPISLSHTAAILMLSDLSKALSPNGRLLSESKSGMEFDRCQSCRISGNFNRTADTAASTCRSLLTVSSRLISAANIRLARNSPQSKSSNIIRASVTIVICAHGHMEQCSIQQEHK